MHGSRFFRVAGLVVLVVLVASVTVYAVPDVIGAEHSFVVMSGSMSPAIETGDVIIVDDEDPATIRDGDIITYQRPSKDIPTTHRVTDVREQNGHLAFETKGDANEDVDPHLVAGSNVIGTVVLTIPYIGFLIEFANTTPGLVVFLGIPLTLLAVTEARSLANAHTDPDEAETGVATDDAGHGWLTSPALPSALTWDAVSAPTEMTDTAGSLSVHVTDLKVTVSLLALATPYTVYVSLRLRSALAFSVAFASTFTLLAAGALWLREHRADRTPTESSTTSEDGSAVDSGADGETPGEVS